MIQNLDSFYVKYLQVSKFGKKLRLIRIFPSAMSKLFDFRNIRQRFEKFGLVLTILREKEKDICTGNIYVLMVFNDENTKLHDDEDKIAEAPYDPKLFGKWSEETTAKLWKSFCESVEKTSKNVKQEEPSSK